MDFLIDILPTIISSVLAFIASVYVARRQSKKEIEKIREEWKQKETALYDNDFKEAMQVVARFINNGSFQKSAYSSILGISHRYSGELADLLDKLADAVYYNNRNNANLYFRQIMDQYRNNRVKK